MKGRIIKFVSELPEIALLILLISTLVDMFLSVFTRYIFGHALFWAEEVGTFGLVWITMIGSAVAVKRKAHFLMPPVIRFNSKKIIRGIAFFRQILIMGFGLIMVITGIEVTQGAVEMYSPALEISLSIMNFSSIVGGSLIVIYAGFQVIDIFKEGYVDEFH